MPSDIEPTMLLMTSWTLRLVLLFLSGLSLRCLVRLTGLSLCLRWVGRVQSSWRRGFSRPVQSWCSLGVFFYLFMTIDGMWRSRFWWIDESVPPGGVPLFCPLMLGTPRLCVHNYGDIGNVLEVSALRRACDCFKTGISSACRASSRILPLRTTRWV